MAIVLIVALCGDVVLFIAMCSSERSIADAWWRTPIPLIHIVGAHGFFLAKVDPPYGG